MTLDQLNILALLLQYFCWCAVFGLLYAGACRVCRMWEKRRR